MKETQDKWDRMRQEANDLCAEIGQAYPPCGFHVGDGWFPHVAKALREIAKVGVPWQLAQVKQKFCQLRIYADIDLPNEGTKESPIWGFMPEHSQHALYQRVQEIIGEAESACDRACESCGAEAEAGPASGCKLCEACRKADRR